MFGPILFLEKVMKFIRICSKKCYWKVKYGKRIKIGKNFKFRKGLIINIAKDGYLEIGNGVFFNNYCSINCHDKIIIGNNNLFGEGVKIYDHNHVFNNKQIRMATSFKTRPIVIGDRNWFGSNDVVLSGAKVGDCNVFSAGAIIKSEYTSDNLVKTIDKVSIEKIKYKGAVNG